LWVVIYEAGVPEGCQLSAEKETALTQTSVWRRLNLVGGIHNGHFVYLHWLWALLVEPAGADLGEPMAEEEDSPAICVGSGFGLNAGESRNLSLTDRARSEI
jgi:hypothetical protein